MLDEYFQAAREIPVERSVEDIQQVIATSAGAGGAAATGASSFLKTPWLIWSAVGIAAIGSSLLLIPSEEEIAELPVATVAPTTLTADELSIELPADFPEKTLFVPAIETKMEREAPVTVYEEVPQGSASESAPTQELVASSLPLTTQTPSSTDTGYRQSEQNDDLNLSTLGLTGSLPDDPNELYGVPETAPSATPSYNENELLPERFSLHKRCSPQRLNELIEEFKAIGVELKVTERCRRGNKLISVQCELRVLEQAQLDGKDVFSVFEVTDFKEIQFNVLRTPEGKVVCFKTYMSDRKFQKTISCGC